MLVGMIFDSEQPYAGRAYADAMAAARSHVVPVVFARRGMRWSSGDGVTLSVLAPSLPFLADTGDDVNENSIVRMLHYKASASCSWAMLVKRANSGFWRTATIFTQMP